MNTQGLNHQPELPTDVSSPVPHQQLIPPGAEAFPSPFLGEPIAPPTEAPPPSPFLGG
jgi:hypothetical protein